MAISWTLTWTQQAFQSCFPSSVKLFAIKRLRNRREGEKDKCGRGERGGQVWWDKQADWHQPLTGTLSAAADWGASLSTGFFSHCQRSRSHPVLTFCNIYKHKKQCMLYLCKFTFQLLLTTTSVNFSLKIWDGENCYKLCKEGLCIPRQCQPSKCIYFQRNPTEMNAPRPSTCRYAALSVFNSANLFKLSTTLHGWLIKHRLIALVNTVGVFIREAHTVNKHRLLPGCEMVFN